MLENKLKRFIEGTLNNYFYYFGQYSIQENVSMTLSVGGKFVFISLHTTRFPTAGIHICADWPLDWSSAAKWALLLITYLTAAVWITK